MHQSNLGPWGTSRHSSNLQRPQELVYLLLLRYKQCLYQWRRCNTISILWKWYLRTRSSHNIIISHTPFRCNPCQWISKRRGSNQSSQLRSHTSMHMEIPTGIRGNSQRNPDLGSKLGHSNKPSTSNRSTIQHQLRQLKLQHKGHRNPTPLDRE